MVVTYNPCFVRNSSVVSQRAERGLWSGRERVLASVDRRPVWPIRHVWQQGPCGRVKSWSDRWPSDQTAGHAARRLQGLLCQETHCTHRGAHLQTYRHLIRVDQSHTVLSLRLQIQVRSQDHRNHIHQCFAFSTFIFCSSYKCFIWWQDLCWLHTAHAVRQQHASDQLQ